MRFRSIARGLAFGAALVAASPALPDGSGLPLFFPIEAQASVSVLLTLDELVTTSAAVVVATPLEHTSVWEDESGGRRIVTYTRLRVERSVLGDPGAEVQVRTLGGVVGSVGQSVSGEARLRPGTTAVLFLMAHRGTLVVTGSAQGHFPLLVSPEAPPRLRPSPEAGMLIPRGGPSLSAREQLGGKTVDEAAELIEKAARHAKQK